ncbi:MOSC domain-containing protein [Mucilaginibacter sp.]|uniref:MOSC domain-containing protein n=1 Tax=Mucilaginibacter sp. TaxID=1882438 RepID=UPI003D0DA76D
MRQISEIYIYPIKSLPGISVKNAVVTDKGFEHDRRWMLVDEHNSFITQRVYPQLTQLQVAIESNGLRITHRENKSTFTIPFNTTVTTDREMVIIWDDICIGEYVSKEADDWFTQMLDIKCRLVYMPDDTRRIVDQRYAPGDSVTSFADAYPFLLIGQASLDDLNSRITEALPMDRFRPNIVFTGGEPYEEDLIGHFTIADIDFYGVKLCARCVLTTINQETAAKGKEPLKTLASYRQKNKKIYFGQNLIHKGDGTVSVGDALQIISLNHEERFMMPPEVKKAAPIDIDKTFGIIVK